MCLAWQEPPIQLHSEDWYELNELEAKTNTSRSYDMDTQNHRIRRLILPQISFSSIIFWENFIIIAAPKISCDQTSGQIFLSTMTRTQVSLEPIDIYCKLSLGICWEGSIPMVNCYYPLTFYHKLTNVRRKLLSLLARTWLVSVVVLDTQNTLRWSIHVHLH